MIEKLLIAFFLTDLGTRWIDRLYSLPTAPLSFPDQIESRGRFRRPIIFVAMILALEFLPAIDSILAMFFLTLITLTDLEQQVILDRMTLPFAILGLARFLYLPLDWMEYVLMAVLGGLIFLVLAILMGGAIGGGDVKLIAILGLWFEADDFLSIVIYGIFLGGIFSAIMLLTGLKSRKDFFAYGPYFTIVAMYFLFAGD